MQLEKGIERQVRGPHLAPPADPRGLVGKAGAIRRANVVQRRVPDPAREPGRPQEPGGKAHALLVGPVDDGQGRFGLYPGIVERLNRLERGQHARDTVEPAPMRLGVEMTAGGDHGARWVTARSQGEHVARTIRFQPQPGRAAPPGEELARGGVFVR